MQSCGEEIQRELSPMERENDPVVRAALVEDDDPEVFQKLAKKPKTSIKPYVEVPEPLDMNFVRCPESKRAAHATGNQREVQELRREVAPVEEKK